MSTPESPRPRRRDRAATRAALLAAARLRFARDGYDATGVRDIAADVGVDPALVFRYFGSKQRLFAEVTAGAGAEVAAGATAGVGTGAAAGAGAGAEEAGDDGGAADLPLWLLRSAVAADWSDYAGEHPFVALLRSSGHEDARTQLQQQICDSYVRQLAAVSPGPDRELRAELLSAWLLGIGVARSVIRTPRLAEADFAELAPYFAEIAAMLLNRPAAAADNTSNTPAAAD